MIDGGKMGTCCIQYWSEADREAAEWIKDRYMSCEIVRTDTKTDIEKYNSWIIVGGPDANPVYDQVKGTPMPSPNLYYQPRNPLPEDGDNILILVGYSTNPNLFDGQRHLITCASWTKDGTLAGAYEIYNNGIRDSRTDLIADIPLPFGAEPVEPIPSPVYVPPTEPPPPPFDFLTDRQRTLFREAYIKQKSLDFPTRYFADYTTIERAGITRKFDLFKRAWETQQNLDSPIKYFEDYPEVQRTEIKTDFAWTAQKLIILKTNNQVNLNTTRYDGIETISDCYQRAVFEMLYQIRLARSDNWQSTSRQAAIYWNNVMKAKILWGKS